MNVLKNAMTMRTLIHALLRRSPRSGERRFQAWQVELTTACALRCRMCPRESGGPWHRGHMSLAQLERMVPLFRDVEAVVLSGWGEPLLYPHLEAAVRLVAETGARPGFVTSGKGLTIEKTAALLEAGLDFLGFSLAGTTPTTHNAIRVGSDFEELLETMRQVREARERTKRRRPALHLVYLLLRDNLADLPTLPALAERLGIREVILTHPILITNRWQEGQRAFSCAGGGAAQDEAGKFLRECERAARTRGIGLSRPPLFPTTTAVCGENPLANLYLSVEGEVSPCVYLQTPLAEATKIYCGTAGPLERLSFGNVFTGSFEQIWETPPYVEFREAFQRRLVASAPAPNACRTCHKLLGF